MQLNPVIPGWWEGFRLRYRHGEAIYESSRLRTRKAASEGVVGGDGCQRMRDGMISLDSGPGEAS